MGTGRTDARFVVSDGPRAGASVGGKKRAMNLKIVTLVPTKPIKLTSSRYWSAHLVNFMGRRAISQLTTGDIHTLGTHISTMGWQGIEDGRAKLAPFLLQFIVK